MSDKEKRLAALEAEVSARLSDKRMLHVRGVRSMAQKMAALLLTPQELSSGEPDLDERIAAAALLHDATKEESFEKQLQLVRQFGIMESEEEARRYGAVIHGMTAAKLIPHRFPFYALPDILDAVTWHTTGHANMNLLGAVIYVADYIEEGRMYPASIAARRFFFEGAAQKSREDMRAHLDRTVLFVLQQTVDYLSAKEREIHPATFETLAFYRQKTATV